MAREPDSIVRIAASGEQPDQIVGVVGDQVITATPSDVGKVVTVAADGSLVLGAGGGGGVADHGDLTGLTDPDHTIAAVTGLQAALDAKQASDADLTVLAALAPSNDDVIQRKAGAWVNRTPAQLKVDLAVTSANYATRIYARNTFR